MNALSIANKTFVLNDFIQSKKLDSLFVTEIWQRCIAGLLDRSESKSPGPFFILSPYLPRIEGVVYYMLTKFVKSLEDFTNGSWHSTGPTS